MAKRWLIWALVFACARAAHAEDAGTSDVNALRERLRGGIEGSAASGAMHADSAGALITIFEDPREARHVRLRALWALTQLRSATTSEFFAGLLAQGAAKGVPQDPLDPRHSALVLRRAIEGLALAAPDDRSVALVAPFFAHRDGRVREAVARALVHVGSAKARELARERVALEASKLVRAQLSLLLAPSQAPTDRPVRPPGLPATGPRNAPPPR